MQINIKVAKNATAVWIWHPMVFEFEHVAPDTGPFSKPDLSSLTRQTRHQDTHLQLRFDRQELVQHRPHANLHMIVARRAIVGTPWSVEVRAHINAETFEGGGGGWTDVTTTCNRCSHHVHEWRARNRFEKFGLTDLCHRLRNRDIWRRMLGFISFLTMPCTHRHTCGLQP